MLDIIAVGLEASYYPDLFVSGGSCFIERSGQLPLYTDRLLTENHHKYNIITERVPIREDTEFFALRSAALASSKKGCGQSPP
jgi:hypothetical protein